VLTGTRFKLASPTLALKYANGKRTALTLPTGTIVKVLGSAGQEDDLIEVLCGDRVLAMFARDVRMRGIEIKDAGRQPSEPHKPRQRES
jgi:hypothetical protein